MKLPYCFPMCTFLSTFVWTYLSSDGATPGIGFLYLHLHFTYIIIQVIICQHPLHTIPIHDGGAVNIFRAVPPKLRVRPKNIASPVGADRDLPCDIHSNPRPTIQWLRNGQPVVTDDYTQIIDEQTLRILGLMTSDEGVYQCVGTNEAGSMLAAAQLVVLAKGLMSSFSICTDG